MVVNFAGDDIALNEGDAMLFRSDRTAQLSPRRALTVFRHRCGGGKIGAR